jgi:serine/threonine protein kinase
MISLFANEFSVKSVKKYINEGLWLNCYLSDYYIYLEYYDEGGYGSIYKVMDRFTGEYLILKRSSKKNFNSGRLYPYFNHDHGIVNFKSKKNLVIDNSIKISLEAEYTAKIYDKLNGIKLLDYYDDDDHYILILEMGGRSLENLACSHKKKIKDLVRYNAYQSNYFYRSYLNQIIVYMIKIYHKIKNIHDLNIHHNDLKPENILINGDEITIIDFGVAKPATNSYDTFNGTLEYIPYEYVAFGSYKPWDHTIWCFGIMLHFLTLMYYPFLREEDILEYNLNYQKINKLPKSFSYLIYDCLQKDPTKRPQNLLERLKGLKTYDIL